MASRLSSLLVRDGLVGVKRMERAFQRQVIYGGALDTILLEMSLVDETTLCEYLSLATGLPAASSDELEMISSEATEACPEELARAFYVAPLTVEDDALRVLVSEPVDFAQLEDLADRLDMAIQPLVAPEFRFNLLFSRAFGLPGSARFRKLAEAVAHIEPIKRPELAPDAPPEPAPEPEEASEPPETTAPRTSSPRADTAPVTPEEAAAAAASEPPPAVDPEPPAGSDGIVDSEVDAGWSMSQVFDAVAMDAAARDTERETSDTLREDTRPTIETAAVEPPAEHATLPPLAEADESHTPSPPPDTRPPPIAEASGAPEAPEEPEVIAAENAAVAPDREIVDVPLPPSDPRSTMRFSSDSLRERLDDGARPKRVSDAYRIVRPLRSEPATPRTSTIHAASPPIPEAAERGADRFTGGDLNADLVVSGEIDEEAHTEPVAAPPLGPLSVADARELLGAATDRDSIFEVMLRALSARAPYAAVMICHGNSGDGRFALVDGQALTAGVDSAAIPLESDSPFKQVVESASPYIGKLACGNPEVDAQAQKLCGGELPPSALLLPIALRNRVVAIAVAHRAPDNIAITEVAEILPLASDVVEALVRLIVDAKKRAASMSQQMTQQTGDITEVPPGSAGDPELVRLLDQVESPVRQASDEAKDALQGRAAEVVPMLDDRFPGRLEVDRYEIGWRTIRASQYGPLMDLVIKLGASCGPMLSKKLEDPRRDVRYYAAVCAAELRPHAALDALVERIFDRDYGVRDIAIHALGGYPASELDTALSAARSALHSSSNDRVVAAANALAVLADLRSIPHLLEVLEGDRETAVPARRALRRLTSQDFAWSIRKWRSWWDRNRGRTRIEWLLDALAHRDEEIRRQAVDDLRTLTGESFNFNPDATRREREDSRAKWLDWWDREGSRRFLTDPANERDMSTAKLPGLDR